MTFASHHGRWFRYSLRTFFVLLTVFCIWLGVQVHWIRDRHAAIVWLQSHGKQTAYVTHKWKDSSHRQMEFEAKGSYEARLMSVHEPAVAPWTLRLFGETGISVIVLWSDRLPSYETKQRELQRLFPETRVKVACFETSFR